MEYAVHLGYGQFGVDRGGRLCALPQNVMWNNVFTFLIVITMFFQGGLVPLYLIVKGAGLIDSLWATIIPFSVNTFNLIIMRTAFMAIPESLEESAKIDKANHLTILLRIILPLSKPVVAVMILYYAAVFWGRGNAWAAITMARALRLIQVTHPSFMVIDGSLRDQLSALVRLQAEDGLWRTVLTDSDAYTETSASAGIAAALLSRGKLYNKVVNRSISGILSRIAPDGSVQGVSAGTAVMRDAEGYKNVPCQRVQGWGQGLTLVFLSSLLAPQEI